MFEKLTNQKTAYEPYKYIMQDTGSLYIGARFSYEELLKEELLGFKMKAIISQYILKETSVENTLESQLYYLEKESFVYEVLDQLKVRVKVFELCAKKNIFGKTNTEYKEHIYSLEDFTQINLAKKKGAGMVVSEMIVSKLALMSFTL